MATPRTPNQKKQYAKLNARLAKYGKLVEQLYDKFNREAAAIALRTGFDPDSDKMFRFQDYPQTREAIQKLLAEYISDMTGTINRTTSVEWENSNAFQDLVANKVLKAYGVKAKDGTEYERYYQTNSDHLKAFQTRTANGMNLSRRVWNLKEQYKQELEMGLSVGIERGSSATSLAKQMKQYLNEPDKLFRRVRDKYGNLQLSKNAKAYHPGRGVYRSSYKNAMRLTRSETNMAYRTAEQTRWKQFDFVVGYEIKLSQSHPCHDVCDELAGKYPKDFVWTGWHPMDMCYCVSILKSEDEFWRDLGEEENAPKSEKEVTDVPEAFKDWVKDNADRIETAEKRGTQPYFIRDNKEYIQSILKPAETKDNINIESMHIEMPTELRVQKYKPFVMTEDDVDYFIDNYYAWGIKPEVYNNSPIAGLRLKEMDNEIKAILKDVGIKDIDTRLELTNIGARLSWENPKFKLERFISRDAMGNIIVDHSWFNIDSSLQNKGISKLVFKSMYRHYQGIGVSKIELIANKDIGGYTWTRYGFYANNKQEALRSIAVVTDRKLIQTQRNALDLINNFYSKHDENIPFPMHSIADISNGKELLLGQSWHGHIDMHNIEQISICERYIGLKE